MEGRRLHLSGAICTGVAHACPTAACLSPCSVVQPRVLRPLTTCILCLLQWANLLAFQLINWINFGPGCFKVKSTQNVGEPRLSLHLEARALCSKLRHRAGP